MHKPPARPRSSAPANASSSHHHQRGARSTAAATATTDPAKLLRMNVRSEFKNTLSNIRSIPEEAYRHASRFVFTFRRYIPAQKLAAMLIKTIKRAMQDALTGANPVGEVVSLLTFSDVWLRSRIDSEPIEKADDFMDIVRKLCRSTHEAIRDQASRVMCSILWAITGRRAHSASHQPYTKLVEATAASSSSNSVLVIEPLPSTARLWGHKVDSLAEMLSYIEWSLFARIPFADFQNKAWMDQELFPNRAVHLRAFIERSNRTSEWVASSVLVQRTDKTRAKAFEAFVQLAHMCMKRGNYSSAAAIISGLQMGYIDRLKNLMPISTKHIVLFNVVNNTTRPEGNYKGYREALEERTKSKGAFIPSVAPLLRDLTMVEDANPDVKDSGTRINNEKMTLLQATYETIHRSWTTPYKLPSSKVDASHKYAMQVFEKLPRFSREELTTISGTIRPYPVDTATATDAALPQPLAHSSSSMASSVSDSDNSAGFEMLRDDSSRSDIIDLPLDLSSLGDRDFLRDRTTPLSSTRERGPSQVFV